MKKVSLFALTVLMVFAGASSVQAYQPPFGCVNLSTDLAMGSRGSEVLSLQRFLLSRNYPGAGAWMVSGYFGRATEAAVRNFQSEQRLLVTGRVDLSTRMTIDRVSCSGVSTPTPIFPTPGIIPSVYPYPQPFPYYPQYGAVSISSLSTTSGYPGTTVTVYGSGFDVTNNAVYFGATPVYAYTSNASSMTVTVPNISAGTMQLYVRNSRGQSNPVMFTVTSNYSNYPTSYPYSCATGYGNNCCGFGQACPLALSYLTPSSGAVGSSVSIIGTGFSATGNTVRFGVGIITGLTSPDGRSISFTVPAQLSGYGSQQVTLGQYPISVTNSSGQTSNTLPFTVTSLGSLGAPSISGVSGPTTLSAQTTGTWTITVNNPNSSSLTVNASWGEGYGANASTQQYVYGSGTQTLTFSRAYPQTGTYTIVFTVTNSNGQSNTSSVTVQITGNSQGSVSISSVSPNTVRVGSQIAIVGTGFSTLDNTVRFGQGGTMRLPSINGNTIYYTIPYAVSPCDLVGSGCSAPTTIVTPGQYSISVSNANGTSGTLYVTVQ